MSVASEITRINQKVVDSYTECKNFGVASQSVEKINNLPSTIASIPYDRYHVTVTLNSTDMQPRQTVYIETHDLKNNTQVTEFSTSVNKGATFSCTMNFIAVRKITCYNNANATSFNCTLNGATWNGELTELTQDSTIVITYRGK